jgi:hypothetical protein
MPLRMDHTVDPLSAILESVPPRARRGTEGLTLLSIGFVCL